MRLFSEGWSKPFDVVRTVCVDQEDLVLVRGWGFTELGQLFVPTRPQRDVGFLMK